MQSSYLSLTYLVQRYLKENYLHRELDIPVFNPAERRYGNYHLRNSKAEPHLRDRKAARILTAREGRELQYPLIRSSRSIHLLPSFLAYFYHDPKLYFQLYII